MAVIEAQNEGNAMSIDADRRTTLFGFGAALTLAASATTAAPAAAADAKGTGGTLTQLSERLRQAPRRRDYKTVPMLLDDAAFWDDAALREVIAYKGEHKQAWDNTQIAGSWMHGMRNSLNTQVFSYRHADFLVVSATHGPAHLALFDQAMWDKYKLADLAGNGFKTNTLIVRKDETADASNPDDAKSIYGSAGDTIPALQQRGVVFMACHNAIWEIAAKLLAKGVNPDSCSHEVMTAELTNHLVDGVVLTPGIVATLVELQQAGFHYIG
jgi:intracellular sulfur oxidation DsrE/DsrF family protein